MENSWTKSHQHSVGQWDFDAAIGFPDFHDGPHGSKWRVLVVLPVEHLAANLVKGFEGVCTSCIHLDQNDTLTLLKPSLTFTQWQAVILQREARNESKSPATLSK